MGDELSRPSVEALFDKVEENFNNVRRIEKSIPTVPSGAGGTTIQIYPEGTTRNRIHLLNAEIEHSKAMLELAERGENLVVLRTGNRVEVCAKDGELYGRGVDEDGNAVKIPVVNPEDGMVIKGLHGPGPCVPGGYFKTTTSVLGIERDHEDIADLMMADAGKKRDWGESLIGSLYNRFTGAPDAGQAFNEAARDAALVIKRGQKLVDEVNNNPDIQETLNRVEKVSRRGLSELAP